MAIVNGYATLTEIKNRLNPVSLQTQATDDTVIENLVTSVSRWIDSTTGRRFFASTETQTYDVPNHPSILMIDDLLTLTTLTNGDGTVITSASYKLYPLNESPKWKVVLLPSSGYSWEATAAGDYEGAISIVGSWGYSASTPADINEVCIQVVMGIYQLRYETPEQALFDPSAPLIRDTLETYKRWTPNQ